MKKLIMALIVVSLTSSAWASWTSYVIRNAGDGLSPAITTAGNVVEFVITKSGQKAGLGTSDADGKTLSEIISISIDRLDDTTRFTAGSGPAVAPYMNIWITDGAGNYAVIANEPSNAEWAGGAKWDMTWDILKTKTVKVYETNNKSWLPNNGAGLKFGDLAAFTIQAPTAAELTAGWSGLGTGAPRQLGTNNAFGFNWIFGDTLSNYVSGDPGYKVANPSVVVPVPAPGAVLLAGMGSGLVGWLRRRRSL